MKHWPLWAKLKKGGVKQDKIRLQEKIDNACFQSSLRTRPLS